MFLPLALGPLTAMTFVGLLVSLLTIHEAGHAIVARACGVAVLEFGIGIPPRLVGTARVDGRWRIIWGPRADVATLGGATLWSLNAIPFGAFVQLAGEESARQAGGLASCPPWQRALVFAAGPLANLLLAFVILAYAFHIGWPDVVTVARLTPGGPAALAGLQLGDRLDSLDGQPVWYPLQITRWVEAHPGKSLLVTAMRPGLDHPWHGTLVPRPSSAADDNLGPLGLGVRWGDVFRTYDWGRAAGRAGQEMAFVTSETGRLVSDLVRGQGDPNTTRVCSLVCLNELTGATLQATGTLGRPFPLLQLAAVISLGLALFNILPLPALDGGRITLALLEAARRRRLPAVFEQRLNQVSLIGLLAILALTAVYDLAHPLFPH